MEEGGVPLKPWLVASKWSYFLVDADDSAINFGDHTSILKVWAAKRRGTSFPAWRDFDLADFQNWWGWLTLIDVDIADLAGSRMTYRLWGTRLVNALGLEMTGKSMTDVYTAQPDALDGRSYNDHDLAFVREIAAEGKVGYSIGPVDWDLPEYTWMATIRLPLASDGRTVDHILSAVILRNGIIPPLRRLNP